MIELMFVSSLFESVIKQVDAEPYTFIVALSRLQDIYTFYGGNSEQYKHASILTRQVIEEVTTLCFRFPL